MSSVIDRAKAIIEPYEAELATNPTTQTVVAINVMDLCKLTSIAMAATVEAIPAVALPEHLAKLNSVCLYLAVLAANAESGE